MELDLVAELEAVARWGEQVRALCKLTLLLGRATVLGPVEAPLDAPAP